MKKLLLVILSMVFVFALCACDTEESTQANPSETISIEEVYDEPVLSLAEAIEFFKENPYEELKGYDFHDNGWLTRGIESVGYIHLIGVDVPENINYLLDSRHSIYTFDGKELIKYSFGETIGHISIDSDFVYCGISEMTGFIFRKDDTVFCVDFNLTELKAIASGVKFVLTTSYAWNSDAWSQPLFVMNDGSIKAYVRWEEKLVEPTYEGGYGGTYLK